jgi:hypothetical protein
MSSNACNRHQQDMDRVPDLVKPFAKTTSTITNMLINVCQP